MHKRIQGPISLDICPIFFFCLEKNEFFSFHPMFFLPPIYLFLLLYKNFETRFLEFFYFKFEKYIPNIESILKYLFNDKKKKIGARKETWVAKSKIWKKTGKNN
jgi:hypothetical protein